MSRDRPTVVDAGPLTHLAEAGALDLLDRFEPLLVPAVVVSELRAGGIPEGMEALEHVAVTVDADSERFPDLDPGETAAIAASVEHDGMLLTDDLDARQRADELEIEVHGSIGVVLIAYAEGRLDADAAKARIEALERDSTLYLSDPLVERALNRIDSEEDDAPD